MCTPRATASNAPPINTADSAVAPERTNLTLADRATGEPLEMGTPVDPFSADAHTANATGVATVNRAKLNAAMTAQGFTNYDQEWRHFTFQLPYEMRFDLPIS